MRTKMPTANGPVQKRIPVDNLYFDPHNPRLPESVRTDGEKSVLRWMLSHGELLELMDSIVATGYSEAEPLLVIHDKDNDYIVIEGNRRLAAVKFLCNPSLAELRKKSVSNIASRFAGISELPVLVYETRNDILDYLGYRHITGIKPWGPKAKAQYLRQIYDRHYEISKDRDNALELVAKMVGSKPYYAKKLLLSFAVIKEAEEQAFWDLDDIDVDALDFSVFHTALSYSKIRSHVGLSEESDWIDPKIDANGTKEILQWVCGKNKIISESRELKTLNAVLEKPAALSKIREGFSLKIAAEYSGIALDDYRQFMQEAMLKLREADKLVTKATGLDSTDIDIVREIRELSRKINNFVTDKVDGDDN